MVQLSYPYMTTGKAIALTIRTFVGKVIFLLFNALSRFIIAFLPRSKCLNFNAAVTVCSDFGTQENLSLLPLLPKRFFLFFGHKMMGPDAMILVFLLLSFKPAFSLSSLILIKRLFNSSSLSAIKMRLLVFLLAILIPTCASSSPAFLMIYSGYKLNKQGDNIQPCHTPFPILNQVVVPCPLQNWE